jgi:hypothetical protein
MARVLHRNNDPVQDAEQRFTMKFSLPDKPDNDIPEMPQYLDDLSDSDLMELYTKFMAWVSYAKADMVLAEVSEEREANNCRLIEAKVLIEQWGADAKGDRVTIAKARRDIDSRVVSQQNTHLEARAYRKLVESVFDRCERGAQLLSRELSRRISAAPRDNRGLRFNA